MDFSEAALIFLTLANMGLMAKALLLDCICKLRQSLKLLRRFNLVVCEMGLTWPVSWIQWKDAVKESVHTDHDVVKGEKKVPVKPA